MSKIRLVCLISILDVAGSSNWAQVTGERRQNIVATAPSPWSRRWGHALGAMETLIDSRTIDVLSETERSRIYILGGDSWKSDTSDNLLENKLNKQHYYPDGRIRDPNYNLADPLWTDRGSGSLLNDIWWSPGADFEIKANPRTLNSYGDAYPQIVSKTKWYKIPDWPGIPEEITNWREYVGCCHPNPNPCDQMDEYGENSLCSTAFVCRTYDIYGTNLCDKFSLTKGVDTYAPTRRWSPRRGHAAVTVYPSTIDSADCPSPSSFLGKLFPCGTDKNGATIWPAKAVLLVMGGRARLFQKLDKNTEANGGLLQDQEEKGFTIRHRTMLVNDVWASTDEGEGTIVAGTRWSVTNQGCFIAQTDHIKPPGIRGSDCKTDFDCWAKDFGNAMCVNFICACRHWSPRERFGVTVYLTEVYVAGGVMYGEELLCGDQSCGTEYSRFLNDVWVSKTLGQTWTELTPIAEWAPRSDLSLVWASGQLWVFGGQGGDVLDATVNPLYSDAWVSKDKGVTWMLNTTNGGWSARSQHSVAVFESQRKDDGRVPGARMLLMFGQEEVPVSADAAAAVLDDVQKVVAAAKKASTNLIQIVEEEYSEPPPGSVINGVRVIPVDSMYSLYPDAVSASQDLFGRGKNVWYQDFGSSSPTFNYVGIDSMIGLDMLGYTKSQRAALTKAGINTIYQLATANKAAILQLRDATSKDSFSAEELGLLTSSSTTATTGTTASSASAATTGDNNSSTTTKKVSDICFERRRAEYLVSLCSTRTLGYDGDFMKTIVIMEGNPIPVPPVIEDVGCDDVPKSSFSFFTTVSEKWKSPTGTRFEEADYVCQQVPRARRTFGSAVMSEGPLQLPRLYVAGGWEGENIFSNDLWYRDERFPEAFFTRTPSSGSSETTFEFDCEDDTFVLKSICVIEYRVIDYSSGEVLRPWTRHVGPLDILPIVLQRKPTRVVIRAIDPSGNRDLEFENGRNSYIYTYVPPFPIIAVASSIAAFFAAVFGTLYAIRAYEKRLAYEKYMAKRLARKLKAEDAGAKRVKPKRRKVVAKKMTTEEIRAHSERNKYATLLGNRATSSNRGETDMVAKKRISAKEMLLKENATVSKVKEEAKAKAQALVDEQRRASNLARAKANKAAGGGGGGATSSVSPAAPSKSMSMSSTLDASQPPPLEKLTLKQYNEQKEKMKQAAAANASGNNNSIDGNATTKVNSSSNSSSSLNMGGARARAVANPVVRPPIPMGGDDNEALALPGAVAGSPLSPSSNRKAR
jgi:hypothetical protein